MEVHHHPNVEKKNFKEYLLEGLMIFLAVTMGFFAESYREHIVNSEKEKHYAKSLIDDLRKDTSSLKSRIAFQEMLLKKMDNVLLIPMNRIKELSVQDSFYSNFIYFYSWVPIFLRNESTITQLKSGGGLNIFSDQSLVDSVSRLDNYYDLIKYNNDWYVKSCDYVLNAANQFISVQKLPYSQDDTTFSILPPATEIFVSYDPKLFVQLFNNIKIERSMMSLLIDLERNYKAKAASLLNYLKTGYNLENE